MLTINLSESTRFASENGGGLLEYYSEPTSNCSSSLTRLASSAILFKFASLKCHRRLGITYARKAQQTLNRSLKGSHSAHIHHRGMQPYATPLLRCHDRR